MELHWSMIRTGERCWEQYRRRYALNERIPPPWIFITGHGAHASIEQNLRYKMANGILLPIEQVESIARDAVVGELDREGVWLSDDEATRPIGAMKGEAIDKAVRLSRLHAVEVAPAIAPVRIEREWRLDIGATGNTLAGRIDLEEADTITDWKTKGKAPSKDEAATSDQLTTYAMAKYVLDGVIPRLRLGFLIDNKTPRYDEQTTTRGKADFAAVLNRFDVAMRVIQSGVFPPTGRDNTRVCNPQYCGYYRTCKYVARRAR